MQKIVLFVLKLAQHRADLCFDVYESPFIKDIKRKERENEESDHVSPIGPKTKMETNMHDLRRLPSFKGELLRIFFKEMEDQIYAPPIGSKQMYIATDSKCKFFFCVIEKPYWESVDELNGYHLVAETCIAFHAKHADINDPAEIVVQVNDTHIAIILLANIDLFSS